MVDSIHPRFPPLHPNIYVGAASFERQLAFEYSEKLRDVGARITYAWWETREKFPNDRELSLEDARRFTDRNIYGISSAWKVWLLFPEQPEHMRATGQSIISRGLCGEAGMCIGLGRPFIVSGPWQDFMFASHAEQHFVTHDEALKYLANEIHPVERDIRVQAACDQVTDDTIAVAVALDTAIRSTPSRSR
jgi:hypothetical protein